MRSNQKPIENHIQNLKACQLQKLIQQFSIKNQFPQIVNQSPASFQQHCIKKNKRQKKIISIKSNQIFSYHLLQYLILIISFITPISSISSQCQFISSNKTAHNAIVSGIKVSSDGGLLVTTSGDATLKIWNITTEGIFNYALYFETNDTINQSNDSIAYSGLSVSKTGVNLIVEAGSTGFVSIYNVSNLYSPTCIRINIGYAANFAAINILNNRVIVGGNNPVSSSLNMMIYDYNGSVWNRNYDSIDDQQLLYFKGYGGALAADDSKLILLNNKGLNIMSFNSFTLSYDSTEFESQIAIRCVISVDNNRIIYFSKDQKGFTVSEYQSNKNRYYVSQTVDTSGMVRDIYLSQNKIKLIVAQSDSTINVYLYQNTQYRLAQTLNISSNVQAYTIAGNSDGSYIFVGDNQGSLYSFKCCPKMFQDITNNCNCKVGYVADADGNCVCSNFSDPFNNCVTCLSGYYLQNTNCNSCANYNANCQSCNSTVCISCKNQFFYNSITKKCEQCQSNCLVCINVTSCSRCIKNYVQVNQICTQYVCSSLPGCISCSNNNNNCLSCNYSLGFQLNYNKTLNNFICTCKAGYYALNANTCIQCSVSKCQICDNAACIVCINNYYFDSTNSVCCLGPNCKLCAINNTCTKCNNGYYLDMQYYCVLVPYCNISNLTTQTCIKCITGYYLDVINHYCTTIIGCLTANLLNRCLICLTNYYFDVNIVYCCLSKYCSTCISNGICSSCISEYFLYTDNMCLNTTLIKNCTTYNVTGCQSCTSGYYMTQDFLCISTNNCNSTNITSLFCINCTTGYFLYINNTCLNITWIKDCTVYNTTGCQTCTVGYYLTQNFFCLSTKNCNFTNITYALCTNCITGYFLYIVNNTCLNTTWIQNCTEYNTTGCKICAIGYYLTQDFFCLSTGNCSITNITNNTCAICIVKSFYLDKNNMCQNNIKYCNTYNNSGCAKCNTGYYQINNLCTLVINCEIVSLATSNCSKCQPNYYFDSLNNYCCFITNCFSCLTNSICTLCISPYYLNNNMCCSSKYCNNCSSNISICSACAINYFIDSQGYCCNFTNCLLCSQKLIGCTICQQGYFIDKNNYCCNQSNCLTCAQNLTGCRTCQAGYFNDINNNCCNISNCLVCNQSSMTTCNQCVNGYFIYIDDGKCYNNKIITNCNSFGLYGCVQCNSTYYLSQNNLCPVVTNCRNASLNHSICLKCQPGYYFDNSNNYCCSIINCFSCITNSVCTLCISHYYLNNNMCCYSPYCSDCTSNISICSSCMSSYYRDPQGYCCNCSNCILCSQKLNGCSICQQGYFIDKNNYCCRADNCDKCSFMNNSVCNECKSGYFLNPTTINCFLNSNIKPTILQQNKYSINLVINYFLNGSSIDNLNISVFINDSRKISILGVKLVTENSISIEFQNPNATIKNVYINIFINDTQYVYRADLLLSSTDLENTTLNTLQSYSLMIVFALIIFINLILALCSKSFLIRENFIICLQKFAIFRFGMEFTSIQIYKILKYLQSSYLAFNWKFNFGFSYFRYDDGNFFLEADSEVLANATIPIILSVVIFCLQLIILILYLCRQEQVNLLQTVYWKFIKVCYFLNSVIVFPLVYFSTVTLSYYSKHKSQYYFIKNSYSMPISLVYIIYYSFFIILLEIFLFRWRKLVSGKRISKITMVILFSFIDSIIALYSMNQNNHFFMLIGLGILVNSFTEIRYIYIRQTQRLKIKILLIVLETIIAILLFAFTILLAIKIPFLNDSISRFLMIILISILSLIEIAIWIIKFFLKSGGQSNMNQPRPTIPTIRTQSLQKIDINN